MTFYNFTLPSAASYKMGMIKPKIFIWIAMFILKWAAKEKQTLCAILKKTLCR